MKQNPIDLLDKRLEDITFELDKIIQKLRSYIRTVDEKQEKKRNDDPFEIKVEKHKVSFKK